VALLSSIALSPELQDRYGRHAKNCDPVSVLRVRTSRLFGEPSSSRFPRVGSACTVLLHTLWLAPLLPLWLAPYCPFPVAGIFSAEWLSSPGGSRRLLLPSRDLLYGRNSLVGYAGSWYSTTSVAHAKVRSAPIPGQPARVNALPRSR